MPVKNNKGKETNKKVSALNTPPKSTSPAVQFPPIHSTVSTKEITENSRRFTRYSFDDNGGGYLGL